MTSTPLAKSAQRRLWRWIIAILVGLGIAFRTANLAEPVFWVDEVATTMRVSGYTQAEVIAQVATAQPLTPPDLLHFQTIRSDTQRSDLLRVLSQSPEHAPLYFVLARFWADLFGTSPASMRALPVLFGLFGLPGILLLCKSYFFQNKTVQSSLKEKPFQAPLPLKSIGQAAMGLLAISPFFIAYSQEARPYSLWVLLLLLTYQFLARSLTTHRWQWWLAYTLSLTLTLYTSLLTVLLVLAQSIAILLTHRQHIRPYFLTTALSLLTLTPWCWIVVTHWQTLQTNTAWMSTPGSLWATLGTWFYSLAVLFFDVPVSQSPPIFGLQVILATLTIGLIGYATTVFIRQAPQPIWSLVLANTLAIPLLLLLIDLIRNGQAAATPRYLMPTHLGAIIMLAYWLRGGLFSNSLKRRAAISFLLIVSLVSCLILQPSPYLKSRNLSNADLTALLNASASPQLITTPHYIQDLISLSYQLDPDITLYVLPTEDTSFENVIVQKIDPQQPTFLFAPSEAAKTEIEDKKIGILTSIYQPPPLTSGDFALTLWELEQT
ncbi:MAG: glycosyltransferase family 39 protein [Cyanobacteria bacterium J06598_1]